MPKYEATITVEVYAQSQGQAIELLERRLKDRPTPRDEEVEVIETSVRGARPRR